MSSEDYEGDGYSATSITIIETEPLVHPVGFIWLTERHSKPRVRVPCGSRRVASAKPTASLWLAMAQQQEGEAKWKA